MENSQLNENSLVCTLRLCNHQSNELISMPYRCDGKMHKLYSEDVHLHQTEEMHNCLADKRTEIETEHELTVNKHRKILVSKGKTKHCFLLFFNHFICAILLSFLMAEILRFIEKTRHDCSIPITVKAFKLIWQCSALTLIAFRLLKCGKWFIDSLIRFVVVMM